MVAALDGQDGCPRPLEGFQDLGMLVSYSPLAQISSTRVKAKDKSLAIEPRAS